MSAVRKVLIQGAGIGGLALANALARNGIEVDVVDGAGRSGVLGVGLNQPSNALGALDEIGLRDACLAIGVPFEAVEIWAPNGDLIAQLPPAEGIYPKPSNNGISRPAYFDILRSAAEQAGARVRVGRTIISIHDRGDDVVVETGTWIGRHEAPEPDSNPVEEHYDLVVGFDGARSRVRQHLFGDKYRPDFTGTGNWRSIIPRPSWVNGVTLVPAPGNVKAVLTPISEDEMYFGLVSPEPGNPRHAPEDYVASFRERTKAFTGKLAELREQVSDDTVNVYVPIEYVVVREPWYRGRVVIAGDAAHTSPPHISQGAAMALEDAVTLSAALRDHESVEDALAGWYERRRDRASLVADMSLALLHEEMHEELSERDTQLLAMGLPAVQAKLAQEAY